VCLWVHVTYTAWYRNMVYWWYLTAPLCSIDVPLNSNHLHLK
jgi:hypothetical protein